MPETDKVTKLNDEIVQAETQRKEVDAKIHTINTNISNLTNEGTRLQGERANLRPEFDDLAAKDAEIAKARDDLEKASGQYQAAFKERITLDNKIDRLEDQAVRTHNIEELKANVSERIDEVKANVSEKVQALKDHAEHLTTAATMTGVDAVITHGHVVEGVANHEILTGALAGAVVHHVVAHHDELIEHAKDKIGEVTESVGASPDHVERQNIEPEIAKHNDHADELNTLAQNFKRELERPEPVDVSDQPKDVRGEFESVANRANELFKQQDKEMSELQDHQAQDPAVRTTETEVRKTMAEDTIVQRDQVTRELCRPVAELNVDERNARTLEDSAGLNKAHLERYGMKVGNEPDGPEKVAKFASDLEKGQQGLKQDLNNGRDQAIANEVTSLQGQHFPEVQAQAQALQGPSIAPQQAGPGGGGAGGGGPQM